MGKSKILIVEDEMVVAMDIENSLRQYNYDVVGIVSSGEEAIRRVDDVLPDIILMDIMLQGNINGIDAAVKISEKHNIPILFLTANSDIEIINKIKYIKSYGYLLKPFSLRELCVNLDMAILRFKADNELQQSKNKYKKLNEELEKEIVERKYAEEQINQLNYELKIKNKELEQIIYTVSHDLRSPLLNINGYTKEIKSIINLLKAEINKYDIEQDLKLKIDEILAQELDESIDYILKSTYKIDKLVSALLKYSRLGRQILNMKQINVSQMINDILKTYDYIIQFYNVKIYKENIPDCFGDELQINQLFSNLIENALKYLDMNRQGIIKIYGREENNNSIYFIEDNGVGIDINNQSKIFELFTRLDPSKGDGEGIGLSIVNKIVQNHKGTIRIESQINKGTIFIITLPK